MWIIVLLVAVSVLVIAVSRRRRIDGRDSVESQRMRLEALRTAVSGTDVAAGRTSTPAARSVRSIRSGRKRGRRSPIAAKPLLLVAATVLVLAAAGLVVAEISSNGSTGGAPGPETGSRPRAQAAPTTSSTTSTTVLPAATILGTQDGVITISVPFPEYRLALTAQGPCWMRAERSDGTVVDTTTLRSGDSRELAGSGPLTVRLGNPGVVDVAVDGQVLALPVQIGAPVDLHFVPPGSSI